MTNLDVFKAFAASEPAEGGSVSSQVVAERVAVLRSYATPIAINVNGQAHFSTERHSVTTAKQRTQAVGACADHADVWEVGPAEFAALLRGHGVTDLGKASS